MRRDPDLQRRILLFIEEHTPPQGGLQKPVEVAEFDRATINAHLELLIEDGLVDGRIVKGVGLEGSQIMVLKLTSAGHDAIAAARNETLWNKAKKVITDKGVSLTFGVIVAYLKAEAKTRLGIP